MHSAFVKAASNNSAHHSLIAHERNGFALSGPALIGGLDTDDVVLDHQLDTFHGSIDRIEHHMQIVTGPDLAYVHKRTNLRDQRMRRRPFDPEALEHLDKRVAVAKLDGDARRLARRAY